MKMIPHSLIRVAMASLVSVLVVVTMVEEVPSTSSASTPATPTAIVKASPLDTSTTTTSPTTTTTASTTGLAITTGPSRGQCLAPNIPPGTSGLANLLSVVNKFDVLTGTTVTCLSAYLDTAKTWAQWEQPWVSSSVVGFSSWVAQEPQLRQLVLAVNLIPSGLADVQNPTAWEQACASGKYDGHATVLGRSLVAAGLQNSVIRLGAEMNGEWEPDFIGTKVGEQRLWAKCFDNEVTGLRRATGEHFLIDWNPNSCWAPYAYASYYPGNAYVDILGLDQYDVGCLTPYVRLSFGQIANEAFGLTRFEAFAASKHKPMSFPEWGLSTLPAGDDPGFISGLGNTFESRDFSFEAYFDSTNGPSPGSLPLSPATPLSVAAFNRVFGS
jgi:hypothetical protein